LLVLAIPALLLLVLLYGVIESMWLLWRPPQGGQRVTLRSGMAVYAVMYSPDGQLLAVAGSDPSIRLWDTTTWKIRATLVGHQHSICSLAFAPDGRTLASGGKDGTVRLWDVTLARESINLKGHASEVNAVSFSPDGTRLASAGSSAPDGGEVTIWDVGTKQKISNVKGDSLSSVKIAFSPDGKILAILGWDWNAKLWDLNTGEVITLPGRTDFNEAIAFAPGGKLLAAADGSIRLWDLATREELAPLTKQPFHFDCIAFSPGSNLLVAGSRWGQKHTGRFTLWDLSTKQEVLSIQGHKDAVYSVAVSPDGSTLASGSSDGTVKIWDLAEILKQGSGTGNSVQ
jgi:WD40 repeat protein